MEHDDGMILEHMVVAWRGHLLMGSQMKIFGVVTDSRRYEFRDLVAVTSYMTIGLQKTHCKTSTSYEGASLLPHGTRKFPILRRTFLTLHSDSATPSGS